MGHKVNPISFRLGIIRNWDARWYADKDYAKLLQEDLQIRKHIQTKLADAGIPKVEIERFANISRQAAQEALRIARQPR